MKIKEDFENYLIAHLNFILHEIQAGGRFVFSLHFHHFFYSHSKNSAKFFEDCFLVLSGVVRVLQERLCALYDSFHDHSAKQK